MKTRRNPFAIGMAGIFLLVASSSALATMQQRETNIVDLVGELSSGQTMNVEFPGKFDEHLAHGDAVGRCP